MSTSEVEPGRTRGPSGDGRGRTGGRPARVGAPYAAAAGLALVLWAVALVWAARAGCADGPAGRAGSAGSTGSGEGTLPAAAPDWAALVDVTSAGEAELRALPGVGATFARRIVEEREASGPFRGAGDLMRVRGFTRELAERVGPFVRFGPTGGPRPRGE